MQEHMFRKNALERLQSPERLDTLMQVTQPLGWWLLVGVFALFVALGVWAIMTTTTVSIQAEGVLLQQRGDDLHAVLYLPVEDVQRVQPGMSVRLAPLTISPQDYGYLLGEVKSIGQRPSEDPYADEIVPGRAAYAVVIALQSDDDTLNGYAWSIGQGPDVSLRSDLGVTGQIILERSSPLARLLGDS